MVLLPDLIGSEQDRAFDFLKSVSKLVHWYIPFAEQLDYFFNEVFVLFFRAQNFRFGAICCFLFDAHVVKLFIELIDTFGLQGVPEYFKEHIEQVDDRVGVWEKLISRQVLIGDVIGGSRNVFFELFYLSAIVLDQNILCDQKMEQFFLYFRVH